MEQIVIGEAAIMSPSVTSRRELKLTLKAKQEDYDDKVRDAVFDGYEDGTTFAVVLVPIDKQKDPRSALRSRLAIVMKEYCESCGYDESDEIRRQCVRLEITSRTELTEDQLKDEIDRYTTGIRYGA